MDSQNSSCVVISSGSHIDHKNVRSTKRQGGLIASLGINLGGMKIETEFDRSSSKTLYQRFEEVRIRKIESEDIKQARRLCKEALSCLVNLLQRVQIEQYTNAADLCNCREAWEDNVEANYRDINRRKIIDQYVFKKLIFNNNDNNNNFLSISSINNNERLEINKLVDEIINIIDNKRCINKNFWKELFNIPVGYDENGSRRITLQKLGASEFQFKLDKNINIDFKDTIGCYYNSRKRWCGTDEKLFCESDWPLHLKNAAKKIVQTEDDYNNFSNQIIVDNVNKILGIIPSTFRNIVMKVVTSVETKRRELINCKRNYTINLNDTIRDELKKLLHTENINEWEAPSRAIASMCMLIISIEHGNTGYEEATKLLNEIIRRIFVCYIREVARDIVRKEESTILTDLNKQVKKLTEIIENKLTITPQNLCTTNTTFACFCKAANELRAYGYDLPHLLDGTIDTLTKLEDGKLLYKNEEYEMSFYFDNISTVDEARNLFATWLILMRIGSVEEYVLKCQEEAQRRQTIPAPQVDSTYTYNEMRAACSVKTRWGYVTTVTRALNDDQMRNGFLLALDSDDIRGYRAMVLEEGGIFVVEYEGSLRRAWVNIESGRPWLITGGEQRSKVLTAQASPVMLIWRDFILSAASNIGELRISSIINEIRKDGAEDLFPNLVFEVAASLLGRGWLLVTTPDYEGSAFRALGLDRRKESYKDYLRLKKERGATNEVIHTLIMDKPVRLNVEGIRWKGMLRCGQALEFVIEGYWKGDRSSLCRVVSESSNCGSDLCPRHVLGDRESVNALFE